MSRFSMLFVRIFVFIIMFGSCSKIYSQRKILLDDALDNLIYKSDEYNTIQKNSIIQKEEYNIINNNFLPKVSLEFNAPSYDHSINVITQPNGDNLFIDRKQANSSFVIDISQPIYFSGGYFNIKSSLNRVDLLTRKQVEYSSNWFNIGLIQPLNGFNQYKWVKKINESRFILNETNIVREIEDLKLEFIEKYFEILIIQKKVQLTKKNIQIKEKKIDNLIQLFENGRILEADLLQEKISLNQLKVTLIQQINQHKSSLEDIKNVLNLNESDFVLIEPVDIGYINFDQLFLKERIKEFGIDIYFRTSLLEAERDVKKAKSERGIQTNLQLAYGTNSVNNSLEGLFDIPSKREYVNLNLKIPILNWSENRRKETIANEKKNILESGVKIATEELDIKVIQTINYIETLHNQNKLFLQNLELIRKNIEVTTNLYEFNRITLVDFDYQIFNEETTYVDFLNNLKLIWLNRFQLRKLTLYDFYENKDLIKKN